MLAEFLREKAAQCRTMAHQAGDDSATANGLFALALELEAQALAIDAAESTARLIEGHAAAHPELQSDTPRN